MKDEHTYGKKMARNGRTKVIYKGTFVSIQTLEAKSSPSKGLGFLIPPQPTDFETFLRPCNQRGLKGPSLDSHIRHWMLDGFRKCKVCCEIPYLIQRKILSLHE